MRVAMIGQKGIPAAYGGVERAVEELSARLVDRGHEVTVFNRREFRKEPTGEHRGIRLVPVRATAGKHTGNLTQSLSSVVHTLGNHYDVVHFHAMGPCLWAPLARIASGAAVVATIQGRDDQRAKWGWAAQTTLRTAAWTSAHIPHEVIVVSKDLQRDFRTQYGRTTHHVPNGAAGVDWSRTPSERIIDDLDLSGQQYFLSVGRLVPEKAIDQAIRAFRRVETDARLVVVGGSSHTSEFVAELEQLAAEDERVILAGPIYGDDLEALLRRADAYVMPSLLEGLPLALLEAMNHRLPVIVSDIGPHVEVVGSDGVGHRMFPANDVNGLTLAFERTLDDLPLSAERLGELERRVAEEYSWDRITSLTEDVYLQAVQRASRGSPHRWSLRHSYSG